MFAIPAGPLTAQVGEYICSKVPGMTLKPGSFAAIAFLNDNKDFVGGAVFNNHRQNKYGNDIDISCAAETSMAFRPHVCKAVFSYAFEQLGCRRITAATTKRNVRTRKFLEALGFVLEGNIRHGYDGKRDALIYGLLVEDCRYLGQGE